MLSLCSVPKYSCLHLFQNMFARCCTCLHCCLWRSLSSKFPGGGKGMHTFWVRNIVGVNRRGESGSMKMGVRGLEIMMVVSAMSADKTSWVRCEWPGLEERCIENTSGYPNHPLPGSIHVGRMRWIEDPGASLICQVPSDAWHIRISQQVTQFSTWTYKFNSTIILYLFGWSMQTEEPPQCIYKTQGVHWLD